MVHEPGATKAPGSCWKCRISDSTLDLLNRHLRFEKTAKGTMCTLKSESAALTTSSLLPLQILRLELLLPLSSLTYQADGHFRGELLKGQCGYLLPTHSI